MLTGCNEPGEIGVGERVKISLCVGGGLSMSGDPSLYDRPSGTGSGERRAGPRDPGLCIVAVTIRILGRGVSK